jgi:hypothetical protein
MDSEEFVVARAVRCLAELCGAPRPLAPHRPPGGAEEASLAGEGGGGESLLQRRVVLRVASLSLLLLHHPGALVRAAATHFLRAATRALGPVDTAAQLMPLLDTWLMGSAKLTATTLVSGALLTHAPLPRVEGGTWQPEIAYLGRPSWAHCCNLRGREDQCQAWYVAESCCCLLRLGAVSCVRCGCDTVSASSSGAKSVLPGGSREN